MASMHRASAMLLVALFSFSLISPALLASDWDSKLPACCSRHGKHHCAMVATESSSGPVAQAGRCLFFPSAKGVPGNRTVSLSGIFRAGFERLVSHPALDLPTESLRRSSYSRADQTRGPPIFLS
jgi:hypothetical protein